MLLTLMGFTGTLRGVSTDQLTQLTQAIKAAATALNVNLGDLSVTGIQQAILTYNTSAAAFSASLGLTALVAATLAYLH